MMDKVSINLLQAELIPKQPLWTLKRVFILWGFAFVAMFSWMLLTQSQEQKLRNEHNTLKQTKADNDRYLAVLEAKVAENKADAVLVEKLATLKLLLVNKSSLHTQLTDVSSTYTAGFSSAMTELSQLHHKDISLQKVNMKADSLVFSGLARKPEAVPTWLAAFEQSTFLSGQSFGYFNLAENEQKLTKFTVSSSEQAAMAGGK